MTTNLQRIADSLERIATAQETLVLMLQVFVSEAEPAAPGPQVIWTQSGPIELGAEPSESATKPNYE